MKYIKRYEIFESNSLYHEISVSDLDEERRSSDFTKEEINKLNTLFNLQFKISLQLDCELYSTSDGWSYTISKFDDEYYYVSVGSYGILTYYECDQWEGLIQCLKDIENTEAEYKQNFKNEAFGDLETEFGKFLGIDISDIYKIEFIWSNSPHFSDYQQPNGKHGTSEKRIAITTSVRSILDGHNIKCEDFMNTLVDHGFIITREPDKDGAWSITLVGQEVIEFFYIIESYAIQY